MIKYSLIIPCFNEAANLPNLIKKCEAITQNRNLEVIIVNNGSKDNTSEILNKSLGESSQILKVEIINNKGYGHGILVGLRKAKGEIIGWTHGDIQTDPADFLTGIKFFTKWKKNIFVKGIRKKRPFTDVFFTYGMSFFESILFKYFLFDINAQPTIFHKDLLKKIKNPPNDFTLDLFFYVLAKKEKIPIYKFPVIFRKRKHGASSWNISFFSRLKFILLTLKSSLIVYKKIKSN